MGEKIVAVIALIAYSILSVGGYVQMTVGWTVIDYWADRYQTLLAGALALGSVYYLARQIALQRRQLLLSTNLALKPEVDALRIADQNTTTYGVSNDGRVEDLGYEMEVSEADVAYVNRHTVPDVGNSLERLRVAVDSYNADFESALPAELEVRDIALRAKKKRVEMMRRFLFMAVQRRKNDLRLTFYE